MRRHQRITCRWSSVTPAQDEEVRAFEWSRPLTGYTLYTVRANRPYMHYPPYTWREKALAAIRRTSLYEFRF